MTDKEQIKEMAKIVDEYFEVYDTLHKRVKTQKWDIEKAITTPISIKHNSYKNKKNEV